MTDLAFHSDGVQKADAVLRVLVRDVKRREEEEEVWCGVVCSGFRQLAFSQCTHALILLFLTVLRTAEVWITLSPPFNATDTVHA